jgi:hypothetical protein
MKSMSEMALVERSGLLRRSRFAMRTVGLTAAPNASGYAAANPLVMRCD